MYFFRMDDDIYIEDIQMMDDDISSMDILILVGGCATPLKTMNVNWDDEIPNLWENKKCFKPPTSYVQKRHIINIIKLLCLSFFWILKLSWDLLNPLNTRIYVAFMLWGRKKNNCTSSLS